MKGVILLFPLYKWENWGHPAGKTRSDPIWFWSLCLYPKVVTFLTSLSTHYWGLLITYSWWMFPREWYIKYSAGHRTTKTPVSGKERTAFGRPATAVLTKQNPGLQNRETENSHYERFPPGQGWFKFKAGEWQIMESLETQHHAP